VTLVRLPVSPDGAEVGWPGSPGPVAGARALAATWATVLWTGVLTCDVAAWRTGAAPLLAPVIGPLTVPVPTPATVLLRVLATDPTTGLETVLLTVLETGLLTLLPAGLATVSLTLARTPLAGEAGDCFGLALDAVPGAAPVLWPPPWPGMMFWVAARTADAAELVADEAGAWFALPLDPAGASAGTLAAGTLGAGTLGAGAGGEEAALAAGAWLAEPGWLAGFGWFACGVPEGWPRAVAPWPLVARLPADWPLVARLPADPELPTWPGITAWAAPATELTVDAGLPAGWPAVSALEVVPAEPGFCVAPGFWSAAARPARSTAKTSAAANPPHAYKQTLRTTIKAREKVADPTTRQHLTRDADNHPYLGCYPAKPGLPPGLAQGCLAA
jgi:hypothetical protein